MNITHTEPDPKKLAGFWRIEEEPAINAGVPVVSVRKHEMMVIRKLLSKQTCTALIAMFNASQIEAPVSVNGLKDECFDIGSKRASGWSEYIAAKLSTIVLPHLGTLYCEDYTATDWWQSDRNRMHHVWEPVAVSPLLRFMRYQRDSEHYAHYDAGYFYDDGIHRTLKSIVFYLTTHKSGATRFINDGQHNVAVWRRNHDDWSRRAIDQEVSYCSYPEQGKALIFDHRLCHDVQQYDGAEGDRIIIRADIIYRPL